MINLKTLLLENKGDCYRAAGNLVMELPDGAKLVHGMVNGQGALAGLRFGHAWCEYNNKVLDHSNGNKQEIPKALYYAVGHINPKECKYYDMEKTAILMLKKKHWGPWEMSGDTIKLYSEDIPDSKGEIGKKNIKIPSDVLAKLHD